MKAAQMILAALVLAIAPQRGSCIAASVIAQVQVTPVQKVIQLLEGMLTKGKAEKHEERVQFAAFKTFCDDTTVAKSRMIKEANEKIDMLKADIQNYILEAAKLGKEIAGHDEDISVWKGDVKAANVVRKIEKAEYENMHKDYSEAIDAINRAIKVLKDTARDRPQAESLAQVKAVGQLSLIPEDAKRVLDAFLQKGQPDEDLAFSPPQAYGYEFQSRGVIEILEKLLDKFVDERTQLEKTEMNTRHAFELLVQDLEAQIAQAITDRTEKAALKAKKLQAKADAEGDLNDTTTTRDADQKYLTDLVATCETKAGDFESRQELRAQELEAIQKAIEILSGNTITGNAEKYLPTLLQVKGATALGQLRSEGHSPLQERVASFLKARARKLHSKVLSALAIRAGADPFQKVKKLIKDLLVRLMEEANEEAEHKGWCDMELSTNEQTRKEKTAAVETLHAEIDMLDASIAKLSEDLVELTKAVADLNTAMAEATKLRLTEKESNAQTIKDAQEAQTAVAQALVVLEEFYAQAGEATALLQQQPIAPTIFDTPYTGMQAESGGVVSMLEVIQSDFARLEADTESAEATAQRQYDTFMTESKVDKSAKETDILHKTAKKQNEEQALGSKKSDVENTQKELNAALDYFEKLKPSCVDAGVTYDARVNRRLEEIESLKEALRILNGEDMA